MPGVRVDGGDVLAVEATQEAVERAQAERADLHRGRELSGGAACDRGRPERLHRSGQVEEERRNECVGQYERYLVASKCSRRGRRAGRAEALDRARGHRRSRRAEPEADPGLLFKEHLRRPTAFTHRWLARSKPSTTASTSTRHDENVIVMGEDVGRAGAFSAPRPISAAASADRVDTPLAEAGIAGTVGLCMAAGAHGVRAAVRRVRLPRSTN